MSTISISDLKPTGSDLFHSHESYLDSFIEDDMVYGGARTTVVLSTKVCVNSFPFITIPMPTPADFFFD
jgi:hypothetical protein